MALEDKMPWNTLAHLLKDITIYDPKQVIDTLLKALEKIQLKMQENNHDYENNSLLYEDDSEETSIEANKVDQVVIDPSTEDVVKENDRDDIEFLELVKETIEDGFWN